MPSIILLILTALTLVAVWRAGWLRREALRHTPRREIEFSPADYVLGFGFIGLLYLNLVIGGMLSPSGRNTLLMVQSLALPAGAVFFAIKAVMTEAGFRKAGLIPRRPGRDLLAAFVGLPVGTLFTAATLLLVAVFATMLGYPAPSTNHHMLETLQQSEDRAEIMGIILAATLIAPFFEELCFRGLLQTLLLDVFGRRHRWAVVVTAAALFALVHVGAVVSLHPLPGLFVLGVVLGWVYERTGSLLPCVLIHAGFNAINLAAAWSTRMPL